MVAGVLPLLAERKRPGAVFGPLYALLDVMGRVGESQSSQC